MKRIPIIKLVFCTAMLCLMTMMNLHAQSTGVAKGHKPGSHILSQDKMPNFPGNTLTSMTIELKAGEVPLPHRHAGFLFVYVLEGEVNSQLGDGPVTLYKAGESWTETPGILHGVAESASKTQSAYILVVFVGPDDEALTTRVN